MTKLVSIPFVGWQKRAWLVCLFALLSAGFLLLMQMRDWIPLPWIGFAQDLGIMVDAAWRFYQGQMPHRDYSSALGPVYPSIVGVCLKLGGPTYESFRLLPGILFVGASLSCFFACFGRVPPLVALVISVLAGFVAGGTYHLGFPPEALSHAVLFNRIGWAAVMVIGLIAYLPEGVASRRLATVQYLFGGLLAGSLLFLKANFFTVAIGIVACGAITPKAHLRDYIVAMLVGASLAGIFWCSTIGWHLSDMARDLGFAAAARSGEFISVMMQLMSAKLLSNLLAFLLLAALLVMLLTQRLLGVCFALIVMTGGAVVLILSNSCGNASGDPLLWTAIVIGSSWLCSAAVAEGQSRSSAVICLFAWGLALSTGISWIAAPQIISYSTWNSVSLQVDGTSGRNGSLAGLLIGPGNTWGDDFNGLLDEGRNLVTRHLRPEASLFYADYCNPFGFATKTRAPKSSLLWYCRISTLSKRGHPTATELFKDSDYVMVPKRPLSADGTSILMELYESFLRQSYALVEETTNFVLLAKKL